MSHPRGRAGVPPWLTIETTVSDDGRLRAVRIAGDLDRDSAPALVAALRSALAGATPHPVDVDLSATTFVDAAGIRALLTCHQLATAAGSPLRLHDPTPQVALILGIAGLTDLFELP